MGLRQKFKAHAQVKRVNQGIRNLLHRIHNGRIRQNRKLDVAQKHTVKLLRNRVLVFSKEGIDLLLGRINGTHMTLTHAGQLDVSTNLLRQLITVLRHADSELGTNRLFKSRQIRILASGKLRQMGIHALVDFGIAYHNRVAVNAAEQHLFFDHLVKHILALVRLGHRRAFRSFLESVQIVQEFRTHNRLAIDHRRDPFHQHGFSNGKGGKT